MTGVRKDLPKFFPPVYEAAYCVLRFLDRFFLPVKVSGLEHVPRRGAFLTACNHKSLVDGPMLSYALRRAGRRTFFLGKRELFRNPLVSAALKSVGSVPLERRSGDVGALKTALDLLLAGEVVSMFPEGTRKRPVRLDKFLPGIGFLALKSRVPVLPAFVSNTGRSLNSGFWVEVRFAPPIPYEELAGGDAQETAQKILQAVRKLSGAPDSLSK